MWDGTAESPTVLVWGNCSLTNLINNNDTILPTSENMPNSELKLPYVFVADDTFPLKKYLMKPYPFKNQTAEQRIFSYRLSRARLTVENAFGILTSRFRELLTTINLEPSKVETIVLCVAVLHNYLRRTYSGQGSAETSFHTVNGE